MRLARLGCLGGVLIAMLAAGPAAAATLVSKTVSAGNAVDRSCTARALESGAGYARQTVTMPVSGAIDATLDAASGDWDVAVFAADGRRVVAGSSSRGASELASGFAVAGSELIVQACRLSGSASSAALAVKATAIDTSNVRRAQLARVSTPTLARRNELADLGLDVTEHGGPGFLEVVLHGAADATKLAANAFSYTIEVPDLTVQARRDRAADAQFAAANSTSELPSGGTTYRRLFDYSEDMKRLAREHPDLVRPITLGHETYEGRVVEGIELATNPNARDGRPVFLQMGVHHAREWPSGEHAMEWAFELVTGYRSGDPRAQRLLSTTRTIVVPIVNPDGFNASREAGELLGHGGGAHTDVDGTGDISDAEFLLAAAANPNEYRRKNCRFPVGEGGSCHQLANGVEDFGVDPNRNYGAFWGGPGSSTLQLDQDYHGPGPFSEPETQNVRELVSGRQVTMLITNHTFSNLVLRPPGLEEHGTVVDEPLLKALGDSMAAENGYSSQFGYQLYDTNGTTEDWTYNSTGGLGYTFEIGDLGFHPPFAETVAEWHGTTEDATGGGNRAAYYKAQEAAADATKHSVLAGRAPAGAVLRVRKTFETPTYDGSTFTDTLDTTTLVGSDGLFEWHVNPSTRPLVAKESGRAPTGDPSPPQEFAIAGRHHAVRGVQQPAAVVLRGPPGQRAERHGDRQRQGHVPDRVADAAVGLGHEDLQGGRVGQRHRDGDHHLGQRPHQRRARLRGGVGDRPGRLLRRAGDQLRGLRAMDRHRHVRRARAASGRATGELDALLRAARGRDPLRPSGDGGQGRAAGTRPAKGLQGEALSRG